MELVAKGNRSTLADLAAHVGHAAKSGFGLSLGRDIYHRVKPNNLSTAFVILVAMFGPILPVLGGIRLLQGYRRGWIGTIFLTCGLSMLAMIAGLFVMLLFAGLISDVLFRIPNNEFLERYGGWFMAATAGLTLFGMMIGLFRRRGRLRRFAAIEHNEAFLAENGFKETAGRDVTHYDADGNALRFLEASPDRLSFMVVGRRGRRAYIDLDENGRMLSYSGIV